MNVPTIMLSPETVCVHNGRGEPWFAGRVIAQAASLLFASSKPDGKFSPPCNALVVEVVPLDGNYFGLGYPDHKYAVVEPYVVVRGKASPRIVVGFRVLAFGDSPRVTKETHYAPIEADEGDLA